MNPEIDLLLGMLTGTSPKAPSPIVGWKPPTG